VIPTVLFYTFAAILVGSALGVITARNPVHSAEFLAIVLVLVYVGAVMVLFLFVVMMLDINIEQLREGFTRYVWFGVAVAAIVIAEIAQVLWFRNETGAFLAPPQPYPADYSNTKALGEVLYTEHVYAFEIASMILLVAIIAAISLTMRKRPGLKVQDIAAQIAVRREDRVRLVKVESSRD
jgi:NADH-quinone oxidoreductase subunit J